MTSEISSQPHALASDLHKNVITVFDLVTLPKLTIPDYQRPYKWTAENINHLFSDITTHVKKKSYRLGSVVFHRNDTEEAPLDIVDGQQRTITLLLTLHALAHNRAKDMKREDLKEDFEQLLPYLDTLLKRLKFPNETAKRNINNNYIEIKRIIRRPEFTEDHIHFLLKKCEVVTFVLTDISEAFQFFDSQNARGRDLSPHDLLKAYHLREFAEEDKHLKAQTVSRWENTAAKELSKLFEDKLFHIRSWAKGSSARYFSKDDVPLFKGVNLSTSDPYPYTDQLRISHHYVDQHRNSYERQIDRHFIPYPFQLDQTIINGRRFFEMIDHYMDKISYLTKGSTDSITQQPLSETAENILNTIDSYDARHRTGDRYVRNLFDCLLIYYIDKFGDAQLSQAIEKIFIWSYSIRLNQHSVQLATVDNHVCDNAFGPSNNLFVRLREAIHPNDFVSLSLKINTTVKSSQTAEIEGLFKNMQYIKIDAK